MANRKSVSWHTIVAATAILISLCALCAPANAGVSPDVGRSIGDAINGTYAFIGETNLTFVDAAGDIIPEGYLVSDWTDSNINIPFPNRGTAFDSEEEDYRLLSGQYQVTDVLGAEKTRVIFVASEDDLEVETEVRGEENFGWIIRGDAITFEATTSLEKIKGSESNYISYKLLDPRGVRIYEVNGISLSDISVDIDGDNSLTLNTTGMRTGAYTLSIETDPETNNGLDAKGPGVSFEVRSKGITITANKETQTVGSDDGIIFTVSTTPDTDITLDVTWGIPLKVRFANVSIGVGEGGYGGASGTSEWDKTENPDDATFKVTAVFDATGSYEITATELISNTTDSISVEIVPYTATVSTDKTAYHIGENVKIKGSATAGDSITLKIDDVVVKTGLDVTEEASELYTWTTKDKSPDSYKIAIWVLPFSDPFSDPPDDSVTIMLLRGGLFADTSQNFVALGDEFTIKGTVPGRDRVDILTIAPDGGGGRGLDPDDIADETEGKLDAPGLTYATSGVSTDGIFETGEIEVDEDVDPGTYTIAVLNYGRDGVWGTSGNDNLLEVISDDYTRALRAKTTDQLLEMLKENTINAAGTDDLLSIVTIPVESGFVTLDELEDVPLGSSIMITGTTNRKKDTSIIVTVEGLDENTPDLKPQITAVTEDEETFYNTFSISFGTASANTGAYEATADDGGGHTDTATVNILMAEEPSVNASITPPPAIEAQEPEPETEDDAEEPTAEHATSTPIQGSETEEAASDLLYQEGLTEILLILWFIVAISAAVWVYRDANALGQKGLIWLILTLIFGIFGLVIWLGVKQKLNKGRTKL